jgi:hypothetical protein
MQNPIIQILWYFLVEGDWGYQRVMRRYVTSPAVGPDLPKHADMQQAKRTVRVRNASESFSGHAPA